MSSWYIINVVGEADFNPYDDQTLGGNQRPVEVYPHPTPEVGAALFQSTSVEGDSVQPVYDLVREEIGDCEVIEYSAASASYDVTGRHYRLEVDSKSELRRWNGQMKDLAVGNSEEQDVPVLRQYNDRAEDAPHDLNDTVPLLYQVWADTGFRTAFKSVVLDSRWRAACDLPQELYEHLDCSAMLIRNDIQPVHDALPPTICRGCGDSEATYLFSLPGKKGHEQPVCFDCATTRVEKFGGSTLTPLKKEDVQ